MAIFSLPICQPLELHVHLMDVSENSGTPKSSILIGFSLINHPFWVPLFLETPTVTQQPTWNPSRPRKSFLRSAPRASRGKSSLDVFHHWNGTPYAPGKLTWLARKSPCLIGNTSSNGGISIVMLVFLGGGILVKQVFPMYCRCHILTSCWTNSRKPLEIPSKGTNLAKNRDTLHCSKGNKPVDCFNPKFVRFLSSSLP